MHLESCQSFDSIGEYCKIIGAALESIKFRSLDLDDLKTLAYKRMGLSVAWRSAWNLSLEDEDPRESKAPWVRLFELEGHYTLDHHRKKADEVANLFLKSGLGRYRDRVQNCAFYIDPSTPFFCRVRHCPICQWRRSQKFIARALDRIPAVIDLYPKHRWIFMTLTVKNCPVDNLRAVLSHLTDSFARLTKQQEWNRIKGWIKTVEVARGLDGSAHPHIHCLALASSSMYLSKAKLAALWGKCLRSDYSPIVHSSRISKCEDDNELLVKIVGCLKYQTKESDMVKDIKWFAEMTKQVNKMHGISFGGCIKSSMSSNDSVRGKLFIEAEKQLGAAMTNSTLLTTTANPGGETQAQKNMVTQKRVRFKRC